MSFGREFDKMTYHRYFKRSVILAPAQAVIANAFAYLKGFAPETIATAVLFSRVGYFNGNNKTVWVMV